MAKTAVADVIIPTEFERYAIERTAELSRFGDSGIVEHDPAFDEIAMQGGREVKMPFWKDLTAARQLLSDAASLTVNKITSDQQSFHRLMMLPLRIHGPSSGAAIFAYPMPSNFYLDFRVKSGFSNSSCHQPSKSTAQNL